MRILKNPKNWRKSVFRFIVELKKKTISNFAHKNLCCFEYLKTVKILMNSGDTVSWCWLSPGFFQADLDECENWLFTNLLRILFVFDFRPGWNERYYLFGDSFRDWQWKLRFLINTSIFWRSGGQNLERRNVERPIFRNFKIANIKITENKLFDNFIFEFNFSFFRNHLNTKNI